MKIEIRLSALTRMEYTETLVVPDGMRDSAVDDLVYQRKQQVDGSEYTDDVDYWEECDAQWEHKKCNCIVKHANTDKEREVIQKKLKHFESIEDKQGITMSEMMLDNANCPARPVEEPTSCLNHPIPEGTDKDAVFPHCWDAKLPSEDWCAICLACPEAGVGDDGV